MAAVEDAIEVKRPDVAKIPPQRGPLQALPQASEMLQCACGCNKFFVTKIDFRCSVCFRSYRD